MSGTRTTREQKIASKIILCVRRESLRDARGSRERLPAQNQKPESRSREQKSVSKSEEKERSRERKKKEWID